MICVEELTVMLATGTGVAPKKVADKPYQEQAQRVTWTFVACNIANE